MRASEIFRKYGIRPNKKLGQHFLIDKNIIRKEVELAEVRKDDVILEIGAGFGMLTEELLKHAKKVIAIEKDPGLVEVLGEEFEGQIEEGRLEVIEGDALEIEFPFFTKCVSNIPYSISSPIVEKLCNYGKDSTLCVQKDFGERLVAHPGDKNYSRITVLVKFYFEPYYLHTVSRSCFLPPPNVDSCIVRLIPRKEHPVSMEDRDCFFGMVKALFTHKKKSVKNAFFSSRVFLGLGKEDAKKVFEHVPHADRKVFQLSMEELVDIFEWCKKQKLKFGKTKNVS